MRLAGFYCPIKIQLEEDIADILIKDEETKIIGQMDILAVNKAKRTTYNTYFWILVIESKNSSVAESEKLAQLLTYAYESLENQASVWGLSMKIFFQKSCDDRFFRSLIENQYVPISIIVIGSLEGSYGLH
ncbi:MAG TPA: hypothetical protein DEV81_04130 [Cyanobacteria bacterium UBA11049]|nr:hypothetical protein [Cyanobacteria bacterium UBA11049]